VKPQELQQPVTRDLFYHSCRLQLKNQKFDFTHLDSECLAKIFASIAQAECGDYDPESLPDYSTFFPCETWGADFQQQVESLHMSFEKKTAEQAKIDVLHILAERLEYGVESFHVNSATARNTRLILVCRYDGLRIYRKEQSKIEKPQRKSNENGESEVILKEVAEKKLGAKSLSPALLQFIPYEEISTVSYKGKLFTISYGDISSHNQKKHGFKLKFQKATINLFRTFTEFHSFYQCNMVKKSVMEKCTRNSVGRVASFFRPSSKIGKHYLFDVVRTRRQAYNAAWKELHAPQKSRRSSFYSSDRMLGKHAKGVRGRDGSQRMCQSAIMQRKPTKLFIESDSSDDDTSSLRAFHIKGKRMAAVDMSKMDDFSPVQLREFVRTLQDSRTCQVCMDAEVSTAFCPCGHVVCCVQCSALVKECPLCRAHITYAQRVFFSCEQQSFNP